MKPPGLWAVTTYFNPARYRNRLHHFRTFRQRLRVPLAVVELAFEDAFDLAEGDADLLVQVRGGDVMWQKERLLNHLLPRLPSSCTCIAWLDCDLVFAREDWTHGLEQVLDEAMLVQPFRRALHLAPGSSPEVPVTLFEASALAVALTARRSVHEVLGRVAERNDGVPTPGFAWVAARDLMARHGFFDACIVGGGDTALACAALGAFDTVIGLHAMNAYQRSRYLAWAEPFHREVQGRIRSTEGDLFHLWHGSMVDRRARERHLGLAAFDFDPSIDLARTDEGAWRWRTDKLPMHRYVSGYLLGRREDG